jgi:hypothetical protein
VDKRIHIYILQVIMEFTPAKDEGRELCAAGVTQQSNTMRVMSERVRVSNKALLSLSLIFEPGFAK